MMHSDTMMNSTSLRRAATFMCLATVGLLIAMFIGTHLPGPLHTGISASDKTIHFWAYLSLSLFLLTSWELTIGRLRPVHYFTVWLICTLYGAFDELTQIPVGRTCDSRDWLFDVMGAVTGLILFRVARPLIYRAAMLLPTTSQASQ
jgi:VanZ family protein